MKFILRFFPIYALIIVMLVSAGSALGQERSRLRVDSTKADTSLTKVSTDTLAKKKNSGGLDSEVTYSAEDSIRFDMKNNLVYLYGKGRVTYDEFELSASYILLDKAKNTVFAKGALNEKGEYRGRPIMKQGAEPPAGSDSLLFNFQTKKGRVFGLSTEVENGFLQAKVFKKNQYDEGFFKNGIYSTCNLRHPHFGIHILKGMVTDKQIITGPAYLEIEDIPFPAAIPFGFFPKTNKRASGILFPQFGEDAIRGFFIQDGGYYFGINDYWDSEVRGTLYSKGSYAGSLALRYKKNYKYNGALNFSYAANRFGVEGTPEYKPQKDFNIRWNHSQSAEANPGTTFSASVNVGTSQYNQATNAGNTYSREQITRSQASSSIAYTKTFLDGLFNFSGSFSHSQNFADKTVQLQLPVISLSMTSLSPFDSKNRTGEQKWYQRITVGYSMQASNSIDTKESLLFKPGALSKFSNGMTHDIPISLSLNALKYFQVSSSVGYKETWYAQTIRKTYSPATLTTLIDTVPGFRRAYNYSVSTGVSTKVYGIKEFKRGNLVALRHVMTPSVGFSFTPDFSQSKYGYYKTVAGSVSEPPAQYSIFEGLLYGGPGSGRQGNINFQLDNNIEAKVKSKSDTSTAFEKIPIIQGLGFSTSYNIAVDTLRWAPISFNGRTAFFKQKLDLNFSGAFDLYESDANGNRINRFMLDNGKVARLTNFNISTNFSFNSEAAKSNGDKKAEANSNRSNMSPAQASELAMINSDPNAFVDFNVPWNINMGYSFSYSKFGLNSSVTNALTFSGDVSVTPKWKIQYSSGFDVTLRKFTFPVFAIYRDLHCWDLAINWIPIGRSQSYSVDLKVKASVLQDLKLSRRRSFISNY